MVIAASFFAIVGVLLIAYFFKYENRSEAYAQFITYCGGGSICLVISFTLALIAAFT